MTENENLKEHNESRLSIIKRKIDSSEKQIEENIENIERDISDFIKNKLENIKKELSYLKVDVDLPKSNINKKSLGNFLEKKEFNLSELKAKGSMFKTFIYSLFTSIIVTISIISIKLFELKLIDVNNLQGSFSKENIMVAINSFTNIIPNIEAQGSVLLGTLTGLIFFILFSIGELIRKSKVKAAEKVIEKEILDYGRYVDSKLGSYIDVNDYLNRLSKELISLSVLFDEELGKLRRINFMKKEDEDPDLKTVKDITRVVKLWDITKKFLEENILENGELSISAKGTLIDSEEYIEKHIKKIYKSEE